MCACLFTSVPLVNEPYRPSNLGTQFKYYCSKNLDACKKRSNQIPYRGSEDSGSNFCIRTGKKC